MVQFLRVFWAFRPFITSFQFCRTLLSIDDMQLYGKYKGCLLIATGVDANGGMCLLVFVVIKEETKAAWR